MIRSRLSRPPFYLVIMSLFSGGAFSTFSHAETLPHTFSAGTPAKAEEVNQNFSHLEQRIQSLEEPNKSVVTDGMKTPLTGSITIHSSNTKIVYGTNTQFLTELTEGGSISIEGNVFQIASIDSDTQLTLADWFGTTVSEVAAYTGDAFLAVKLNKRDKLIVNNGGYLVQQVQRVTGNEEVSVGSDGYVPDRKLEFYKSDKDSTIRITYTDRVRSGSVDTTPCYYEIRVNRQSCYSPKPVRLVNIDESFSDVLYCRVRDSGILSLEVFAGGTCSWFGWDEKVDDEVIRPFWSLEAEEVY